mgnify:CR=1 FL=1|jgi:hypothetical protein
MTEEYTIHTKGFARIGLESLKKWSEALKKNKRKARGSLKDQHGGRCCLRVAEEALIPKKDWSKATDDYPRTTWPSGASWRIMIGDEKSSIRGVDFSGLNDGLDSKKDFYVNFGQTRLKVKGKRGLSHNKIAEIIDYAIAEIEKKDNV